MKNQSSRKNNHSINCLANYKPTNSSIILNEKEILDIINSNDFIEFIENLDYNLEDRATLDSLFSSKLVLKKALVVLKEVKLGAKKKNGY